MSLLVRLRGVCRVWLSVTGKTLVSLVVLHNEKLGDVYMSPSIIFVMSYD